MERLARSVAIDAIQTCFDAKTSEILTAWAGGEKQGSGPVREGGGVFSFHELYHIIIYIYIYICRFGVRCKAYF